MSELVPMTQAEYDVFVEYLIVEYAKDNVRAGYWHESEALEKSRKETEGLLPKGLHTENTHIYTVYDGNQAVGVIWFKANLDRPTRSGFIFDIEIKEEFRGKGYGKQAMQLIEAKARELGLKSISLHVFASNRMARNLYEGLGYQATSLNMTKPLE
jgi:ribosomal protein S18 acetylase RimI-like enzyme